MGMKRSLEITIDWDAGIRSAATGALEDAGIEIAASQKNFIQVRKTTPTEVRRVLKGFKLHKIGEGFRR